MTKNSEKWEKETAVMLKADTARVLRVGGTLFLIIGHRKNTQQDPGQWTRNGVPVNFDYLEETAVASGKNMKAVMANARRYKKLLDLEVAKMTAFDVLLTRAERRHR